MTAAKPNRKRVYAGKSPEARRTERRTKLITAAGELYRDHGYYATTIKQICQHAGLTERYFYESFKRQEELFAACYDEKLDHLLRTVTNAVLGSSDRSLSALAECGLTALFQTLRADPVMAKLLLIEIYGVPYDQDRLFRLTVGRFSGLVQQVALGGKQTSGHENYDLELLSAGLVGVCIQMAQRWAVDGYRHPPEQLVHNCMLIFGGLSDRLKL